MKKIWNGPNCFTLATSSFLDVCQYFGVPFSFWKTEKGSTGRLVPFNMQNAQFLMDLLTSTGQLLVKDKKYKENSIKNFSFSLYDAND